MALKALMLRKKIDGKKKELEALRVKAAELVTREAEIAKAIEEAESEEERAVVEEEVNSFEADKSANTAAADALEGEIRQLEEELEEEERSQDTSAPAPAADPEKREVKREGTMRTRGFFKGMSDERRSAVFGRDDVKAFLGEVRAAIKEKRAVTGVGNIIPEVFLGILRENMLNYSKLYRHVTVRAISGTGRMAIQGAVTEAIWTECCANLNELDLPFYSEEFDCWRAAGYYAVCNAVAEDADIDLADTLLEALSQAIGIAVDKAILFGTGTRMPLGVVTRLAQTAKPAGYSDNARPWADLHTTNIKTIAANVTGKDFFAQFVIDAGAAKGKYSRGQKVWVMNETTYTAIIAQSISIDAGGAIVAGVNGAMPVIGGVIEVLDFIPDNVVIGGYFDLYYLVERAGAKFMSSEHVRFLADQTVYKGTARYDGKPVIAEAFVAIGINGTTPTAAMTFAPDTANTSDSPDTSDSQEH